MDEKRYLISVLVCKTDDEKQQVQVLGEFYDTTNSLDEKDLLDLVKVDTESRFRYVFKFWKELNENESIEDYSFENLKEFKPKKDTGRYVVSVTFNLPTEDGGNIVKEILEEVKSLDYDGVKAFLKLKYPEITSDCYIKVIKELEEDESLENFEDYHWIIPSNFNDAKLLDINE